MVKVLEPGLYTTIQDLGRIGFRDKGVPTSGAMDQNASSLANALVDNSEDAAVLEFTMIGPILFFQKDATIAVTGALFIPFTEKQEFPLNNEIRIKAGSTLRFKTPKKGLRGYLAIRGGFDTESILNSRSFYKGITPKDKVFKNDVLTVANHVKDTRSGKEKSKIWSFADTSITAYKGPEFKLLTSSIQKKLRNNTFSILPDSNRMAILLNGVGELDISEIITAPVQPGTVQLTPSGKLMILMRDAQTTGGYLRVLQLSENAINQIAQKRPHEHLQFLITD